MTGALLDDIQPRPPADPPTDGDPEGVSSGSHWINRLVSRVWAAPLVAHLAAYAILLLALLPYAHVDTGWTGDEGSYAIQAQTLQAGDWEYPYAAQEFNPKGSWVPISGYEGYDFSFDGRFYIYIHHPAYIVALRTALGVFGSSAGLHVLPLLGGLLTALTAGLIAREWNERAARPALWIAGLSPVMVNSYALWGHALSAGLAGLTILAAIRIARRGPTVLRYAGFLAAAAAGVGIRSEGQLLAILLALGLGAVLLTQRRYILGVMTALGTTAFIVILRKLEFAWRNDIVGRDYGESGIREGSATHTYWGGRLPGAWHITFQGSEFNDRATELVLLALAVVAVTAVALRLKHRVASWAAVPGAALIVVLYLVRFNEAPRESITGIFAAWPILVAGALWIRWRRLTASEWMVIAVSVLYVGAVFATQFDIGGALEWGGRFLSPLNAPLAAVVAVGFTSLAPTSRVARGLRAGLLVIVMVIPASSGMRMLNTNRAGADAVYSEIDERASKLIVLAELGDVELARVAWRLEPEHDWLFTAGDTPAVLKELHSQGFDRVTVIAATGNRWAFESPYTTVDIVTGPDLQRVGREMFVLSG